MFLNPMLIFFFALCTLAFLGGIRVAGWALRDGSKQRNNNIRVASVSAICVPLIFCILWAIAYLHDLGGHINIAALLVSQQGGLIKESGMGLDLSTGRLALSEPFLIGVLWWSFNRYKLQANFTKSARIFFLIVFWCGFGVATLVSLALVDRSTLMPLVIGTAIIALHHRYEAGKLSRSVIIVIGIASLIGMGGIFALFSYLRGFNNYQLILGTMAGYSIASYNRTAAVLSGLIVSPFPGKPIHLIYYLVESIRLENIFHYRASLSWPDSNGAFLLEFSQVSASGLNPSLIWLGLFGYVFTDIGWLAPIYICVVGFITGWAWVSFRRGQTLGLILFPWLGFCILFWIGSSIVFNETFFYLCEVGCILWIYERLFFRPTELPSLP